MGLIPELGFYEDGEIVCLAEASFVRSFKAERDAIQGKEPEPVHEAEAMDQNSCILRFKIKEWAGL